MTDQELRELVRESIAKQLGGPAQPNEAWRSPEGGWRSPSGLANTPAEPLHVHASHGVYAIARNDAPSGASGDPDNGPCIIEPSVPCTHCNYCKSHGH